MGQSILESYSRVMESLAFNIMARIDDLLFVDNATKQRSASELASTANRGGFAGVPPVQKRFPPCPFSSKLKPFDTLLMAPIFSSSKQQLESPTRDYYSANRRSRRGPGKRIEENWLSKDCERLQLCREVVPNNVAKMLVVEGRFGNWGKWVEFLFISLVSSDSSWNSGGNLRIFNRWYCVSNWYEQWLRFSFDLLQ